MLVLSRKKDEAIVINDDITIVVVDIKGDKVRLGVEAPKKIPVHRREVFDAIHRNERDYEVFKACLRSRNFEQAYDLFYKNQGDFGEREEINRMWYGLQETI